MKKINIDIYSSLKTNRLITISVVITSTIISLFAIYTIVKINKNSQRFIYGISKDVKMLPLERMDKKENEYIFQKGHIELFANYFYNHDQWNFKKQIEKALWLIDDSGKKLYFFYKDNGHYNKLIQSNTSQDVENVKIKLDAKGNFIAEIFINLNKLRQEESETYKITAKGRLISVSQNYPKNPYGYIITNYKETSKNKINN